MALLSRQRPQTRCRRCSVNITSWANRLWISKTRLPDACEVMTKRTTRTDSASQTPAFVPGRCRHSFESSSRCRSPGANALNGSPPRRRVLFGRPARNLGGSDPLEQAVSSDRHSFYGSPYARIDHSNGRHRADVFCTQRLGANGRRKRHQWWCSSKVWLRFNRTDGHRRQGWHVEVYDEGQKEKEEVNCLCLGQKPPARGSPSESAPPLPIRIGGPPRYPQATARC